MRRTWELLAASVVVSILCQLALMAQAPPPPKPTEELSPMAYTFLMEFQGPDGKWAPLMESKLTKGK